MGRGRQALRNSGSAQNQRAGTNSGGPSGCFVSLPHPVQHLIVYHLGWCGAASRYEQQVRRRSFGERMIDTEKEYAAFGHDWARFLTDKPYVRIGHARQHFPGSHRIQRGYTWIQQNCDLKSVVEHALPCGT